MLRRGQGQRSGISSLAWFHIGKNFAINTSKNCWHCFRHKSGGGPLEWIAVQKGIIRCEMQSRVSGVSGELAETIEAAKEMGFDIPDKKPSLKVLSLSEIQETFSKDPKGALKILYS